jgi:hypothetical protein
MQMKPKKKIFKAENMSDRKGIHHGTQVAWFRLIFEKKNF